MTNRIPPIDRHPAAGPAQESIALIEGRKIRPNNYLRELGHSPAALGSYLAMNEHLARVQLGARLREQISLAVAQYHACGYCLSAHAFTASRAGLDAATIAAAREGQASDPHEAAAVAFALALVETRGRVSPERLAAARTAGLSDADLIEIAAVVANMTFSNYVNLLADTEIDFPRAENLPDAPPVDTSR